MHIAITTFDSNGQPRTVKLAPRQAAAERALTLRLFPLMIQLAKASKLMVDTVFTPPGGPSQAFNSAFLMLYLDTDAMKKLETNPALYPKLIGRHLPQGDVHVPDNL